MIRAIVFDFDGVIADSERLHFRSLQAVAEPLGVRLEYDHYLRHYVSYDDRDSMRALLSEVRGGVPDLADAPVIEDEQMAILIAEKAVAFERALREKVQTIPGVEAFFNQLPDSLPLAIASGSSRRDLMLILNSLGLAERFTAIVTADDVARSKPDPESYHLAVEHLAEHHTDLMPGDCLAIEDTPGGIASARGAGLMVLGLTTTCPAEQLHNAHRIAPDFSNLSFALLREWFG